MKQTDHLPCSSRLIGLSGFSGVLEVRTCMYREGQVSTSASFTRLQGRAPRATLVSN